MIGRLSGLTVRIKKVAPECEATHCVIHRKMLASRKLSPELHSVFGDVVKMINLIKAHALNTRLFEQICEGIDAEHKRLLLHTEVRWLSRGKSLNRVFELREPLQRFLLEKNSDLANKFSDEKWVLKLAYLCDIFNLLNEFELSFSLSLFHQIKIHERNKMQNKAIWNVGKEHRRTFRFSKSRCSLRKKENYKIEKRNKRVKQ